MKQQPPEMQKITVEVPRRLLESAKEYSGKGTTEIIRDLMGDYVARQAQVDFLKLYGTLKPAISIKEMRSWED